MPLAGASHIIHLANSRRRRDENCRFGSLNPRGSPPERPSGPLGASDGLQALWVGLRKQVQEGPVLVLGVVARVVLSVPTNEI